MKCNPDSVVSSFLAAFEHESSASNFAVSNKQSAGKEGMFKLENRPETPTRGMSSLRKNGGWGDPRDQHLCLKIAMQPS